MTDEELKEIVAGLAVAQAETGRLLKEQAQAADRRQQAADRRQQEADRRHEETESLLKELAQASDRRQAKLDRQLQALRENVGGLANKFGSFTEALAFPSMEKLLTEKFEMEFVDLDVRRRRGRRRTQIDALAHSNTEHNAVYVVEIKSRLKDEGLDQILRILESFFDFFPEHRGKKLYAILAAVEAPDDLRARVLEKGIYMAQISDDIFQIEVPEDFQPRSFSESIV